MDHIHKKAAAEVFPRYVCMARSVRSVNSCRRLVVLFSRAAAHAHKTTSRGITQRRRTRFAPRSDTRAVAADRYQWHARNTRFGWLVTVYINDKSINGNAYMYNILSIVITTTPICLAIQERGKAKT
jgi:hypothetical protein